MFHERKKWTDYALIVMKDLNFIIILYLSLLMAYCLRGYVRENSAVEFLAMTDRIPVTAWKVPALVICLYVCCLPAADVCAKQDRLWAVSQGADGDCALSFDQFSARFQLHRNFASDSGGYGALLHEREVEAIFVAAICIVYLAINFDLLSVFYNFVPFDVYLEYFQKDVRSVLLGISNILNSLNTFLFFVYIFLFL